MNEICQLISSSTISEAWLDAFKLLAKRGVEEITPLLVTIDFNHQNDIEVVGIRQELDRALANHGEGLCDTVANTIFPLSLWNPDEPRGKLFNRYLHIYDRLKRASPKNNRGTYFQRLIAYGPKGEKNQLDYVIRFYKRGKARRSALQAATFDPIKDSGGAALQGFPCLQHVTFAPYDGDLLAVTGFYATQYLFERAYGNYLGLYRLGKFMAHEMDLKLGRLNCMTGIAMRGEINKQEARSLIEKIQERLGGE